MLGTKEQIKDAWSRQDYYSNLVELNKVIPTRTIEPVEYDNTLSAIENLALMKIHYIITYSKLKKDRQKGDLYATNLLKGENLVQDIEDLANDLFIYIYENYPELKYNLETNFFNLDIMDCFRFVGRRRKSQSTRYDKNPDNYFNVITEDGNTIGLSVTFKNLVDNSSIDSILSNEIVSTFIDTLPDKDRNILLARLNNNFSNRQLSTFLKVSPKTVQCAMDRIRKAYNEYAEKIGLYDLRHATITKGLSDSQCGYNPDINKFNACNDNRTICELSGYIKPDKYELVAPCDSVSIKSDTKKDVKQLYYHKDYTKHLFDLLDKEISGRDFYLSDFTIREMYQKSQEKYTTIKRDLMSKAPDIIREKTGYIEPVNVPEHIGKIIEY